MAQLSPDSFAFGGQLMPVEEAVRLIASRISPVPETEDVALAAADGRVLAQALVAPLDLPPYDNSAVDGYAVRFCDLATEGPTRLAVTGRVAAGGDAGAVPSTGAVRIFTGAAMPPGCDTVFMQEDVTREGDDVLLPPGLVRGANTRRAGEDLGKGGEALPAGRILRPQDVALAAALGQATLRVRRKVRVAVLSTGNEVVAPGEALRPAALYDSNRFLLMAMLGRLGAAVTDLGILPDDPAAITDALGRAAADHDLVLTSGGVSTGEEDHVKAALEAAGSLVFWRLAIKPGRPVAMGVIAGAAFVGLPGNPVAVFVTFAQVVRPLLAALAGAVLPSIVPVPVVAGFSYRKKEGRREYARVTLSRGAEGRVIAHNHPREGAGVITSLTETDGLVELPEATTRVTPGDRVGFIPYGVLS